MRKRRERMEMKSVEALCVKRYCNTRDAQICAVAQSAEDNTTQHHSQVPVGACPPPVPIPSWPNYQDTAKP